MTPAFLGLSLVATAAASPGASSNASAPHPEAGRCGLPEVHRVLRGEALPSHPGMREAPAQLGPAGLAGATAPSLPAASAPAPAPAPAPAKSVYGSPYANHIETENFTVNWWDDAVSREHAELAAAALETAWTSFIEEQGWPEPVSSDTYYLWVLLDRGLGSTTGYTTEYFTEEYPQGYPVIYLNPDQFWNESFWQALSAHEFMHTVQYGMREWDAGGTEESWYWEASANHASELADPSWDGHQYTAAWYTLQPQLRYDSYDGYHQYGIFVLNAWLEEQGEGLMRRTWEEGVGREDTTWDLLLAEASGMGVDELWAGFSAAVANEELPESALYEPMAVWGDAEVGATGSLAYLGSHAWEAPEALALEAEGDVVLGGPGGQRGGRVVLEPGELLTVTALSDGAEYTLVEASEPVDTGLIGDDTGELGDSGGASDGGGVGGGGVGEGQADEDDEGDDLAAGGCACASGPGRSGAPAGLALIVLATLVSARVRSGAPRAAGPRG